MIGKIIHYDSKKKDLFDNGKKLGKLIAIDDQSRVYEYDVDRNLISKYRFGTVLEFTPSIRNETLYAKDIKPLANIDEGLLNLFHREIYRQAVYAQEAYSEMKRFYLEFSNELINELVIYPDLSYRGMVHQDRFWYHVQCFFNSLGILSDLISSKNYFSELRCKKIRLSLNVAPNSIFLNQRFKRVRNCLVHFDEQLMEKYYFGHNGRYIVDCDFTDSSYLLESIKSNVFIRNFIIDKESISFYNEAPFEIKPVVKELTILMETAYAQIVMFDNLNKGHKYLKGYFPS